MLRLTARAMPLEVPREDTLKATINTRISKQVAANLLVESGWRLKAVRFRRQPHSLVLGTPAPRATGQLERVSNCTTCPNTSSGGANFASLA